MQPFAGPQKLTQGAALGCAADALDRRPTPDSPALGQKLPRPCHPPRKQERTSCAATRSAGTGSSSAEAARLRGTYRHEPAAAQAESQVIPLTALHPCDPPTWASPQARASLYNNTTVDRVSAASFLVAEPVLRRPGAPLRRYAGHHAPLEFTSLPYFFRRGNSSGSPAAEPRDAACN